MNIGDGQNDGIFKIQKGENLSQAIMSELGLSAAQICKIDRSVWTQIFAQIEEASQEADSNIKKETNGQYNVQEGQVVKFTQKTWNNITNIVNQALNINIKTDYTEEPVEQQTSVGESNKQLDELFQSGEKPPAHIDMENFSVEALRIIFPEDKFDIDVINTNLGNPILVMKDEAGSFFVVSISPDGTITLTSSGDYENSNIQWHTAKYDSNGNITVYCDKDYQEKSFIAEAIHDDVCAKKEGIIPTTGVDIAKHIRQINEDNVLNVMQYYNGNYDADMIRDIMSEYGMKLDTRLALVKHIKDALVEKYKRAGIYTDDISAEFDAELRYQKRAVGVANGRILSSLLDNLQRRHMMTLCLYREDSADVPNGKIDNNFKQGQTGDCWLVSTIKSLENNPKTKEALESLISVDAAHENITVTLKGVNRKYIFSFEEVAGANELSSGDMDVRAIEMAVNQYYHDEQAHSLSPFKIRVINYGRDINYGSDINYGGFGSDALNILFGKGGRSIATGESYSIKWGVRFITGDGLIEKIKTGKYIVTVSSGRGKSAINEEGNKVEIHSYHAYSVVDADDEYVYIVNPWDTSEVLKITHEDFKSLFDRVNIIDASEL